MDATATIRNAAWDRPAAPVARQLLFASGSTLAALLVLAALFLFERRVAGALRDPLPALPLAILGVALATCALVFRHFATRTGERTPRALTLNVVPTLVLLLVAIALLVPGTTVLAWTSFLGVVLVEEGWSWGRAFSLARVSPSTPMELPSIGANRAQPTHGSLDERLAPQAALQSDDTEGGVVDEHATQWTVRRSDPEAGEIIEGWVRCAFESGQRHATAHLAICPPLMATPVCYAEASDGPSAQVKVAQVLPYGVRLEIKLDQPAEEPCDVQVEFSILERAAE